MSEPIQFYFDFISPYAYLAWTQIGPLAARAHRAVEPIPVLFAGLLDAHGTLGPAEVPARRRYVMKDAARKASALSVPINVPFAHPFNPLLALRTCSMAPLSDRSRLVSAVFRATWVDGQDVTDKAVMRGIVASSGLDPDLVGRADEPYAKALVRRQTDEAIAQGAFGVPTMVVGGELFWGTDSLPCLERFLERGDIVSPAMIARWEALPSAAVRPGSRRSNRP